MYEVIEKKDNSCKKSKVCYLSKNTHILSFCKEKQREEQGVNGLDFEASGVVG